MRISSGKWRGKNILAPDGKLKPTSDKVRQALFNTLRTEILGTRFLDLFAGSGSVGITALSEGASFVVFVEQDSKTYKALRENLQQLAEKTEYQTYRYDALKITEFLKNQEFDIIFADPFYPDISNLLSKIHHNSYSLLSKEGLFILEHGKNIPLSSLQALEGYTSTKSYGDTVLSFFRKH
ncbi:MAG: 16S rRNA (guanine(966)-N(2))-methyltransferase RsmD [Brevinema sp.]